MSALLRTGVVIILARTTMEDTFVFAMLDIDLLLMAKLAKVGQEFVVLYFILQLSSVIQF